jgi:hypothetical protein
MQNDFRIWRSKDQNIDNTQAFIAFEKDFDVQLPDIYKDLVRLRDGGLLQKDLFYYNYKNDYWRNCVGRFLYWQKEDSSSYYSSLTNLYQDPPEFFPKGLIPFSQDGGGNYLCFDYRNSKENPPIVFWHHAVEENEGIFYLADSFEEFINNLKDESELDSK